MDMPFKVIVFDFDETLGYFPQFYLFWKLLLCYLPDDTTIDCSTFNNLLDLYPELFRINLYTILNYIKHTKEEGLCDKVILYTNNQCSGRWIELIINYLEQKLKYKLFDVIIKAYKIKNNVIEKKRTTHDKIYSDLLRCGDIPLHSHICVIDDRSFTIQEHKNVYYVKTYPYVYKMGMNTIIKRFVTNNSIIQDLNISISDFINYINNTSYNNEEEYNENNSLKILKDKNESKRVILQINKFINFSYKT